MLRVNVPLPSRARLEEDYVKHTEVLDRVLFEFHRRIKTQLAKVGLQATVKYRVKSFESYYQKLLRRAGGTLRDKDWFALSDVLGIRIVCPFIADLAIVERMLNESFLVVERDRKGAEFSFKEFGYESLHYLVRLPQDMSEVFTLPETLVCEVQLRTILQDAWAEVEHELVYKSEYTPFDESLRRKLAALNANLSLADMIFHEIREYQREMQRQLRKRRADFWDLVKKSESEHLGKAQRQQLDGCEDGVEGSALTAEVKELCADMEGGFEAGPPEIVAPSLGSLDSMPELAHHNAVDAHLLKALYAHNAHRYQEALALYTEILEMHPKGTVRGIVYVHRGMVHFALGKYDLAIEDFGSSIEYEGDHRRAYYYRAVSLRMLGMHDDALTDLNRCLEIDPYQPEALLSRAQTFLKLGDYATALQDTDAALAIRPQDEETLRFRASLTRRLGL